MHKEENQFAAEDGLEIYYQVWKPEKDQVNGIIQIIHGLGEHSGRYQHVVDALVPAGYIIYADDHRGHGKTATEADRGNVKDFSKFIKDQEAFTEVIRKEEGKELPLFLLGHSMGSVIAIRYVAEHYKKFKGVILSGAGTRPGVGWLKRQIVKVMAILKPDKTTGSDLAEAVSRDPEVVKEYKKDPLVLETYSAKFTNELFNAIKKAQAEISKIKRPILIQSGSEDRLMQGVRFLFNNVVGEDKTLKIYEGLYHEVYNELEEDRRQVLADLKQWIDKKCTHN